MGVHVGISLPAAAMQPLLGEVFIQLPLYPELQLALRWGTLGVIQAPPSAGMWLAQGWSRVGGCMVPPLASEMWLALGCFTHAPALRFLTDMERVIQPSVPGLGCSCLWAGSYRATHSQCC